MKDIDKKTQKYIDKEIEKKLEEQKKKDLLEGISVEERKARAKRFKNLFIALVIGFGAIIVVGLVVWLSMYLYSLSLM